MNEDLLNKIQNFPSDPGVYLMKGEGDRVIYVGKAINLRSRVRNYFQKEKDSRYHIEFLMRRVRDIDVVVTVNEKEALLLENSLIKKYKPRYNINLKDDKSYLSLKFTLGQDYPRLIATRQIKKDGGRYFGPYVSADDARKMMNFIYRHFRLRTCSDSELSQRSRPCLEYQIGRCTAPCVGLVSKEDYALQVAPVVLLLEGKNKELMDGLIVAMQAASVREEFEEAGRLRDLIKAIETSLEKQNVLRLGELEQDLVVLYREGEQGVVACLSIRGGALIDSRYYPVRCVGDDNTVLGDFLRQYYLLQDFIPDEILTHPEPVQDDSFLQILEEKKGKKVKLRTPQKGEKMELIDLALKNALSQFTRLVKKEEDVAESLAKLAESLHLAGPPARMECYDISHHSGKQATASRVVFINGLPDKSHYRHYKIQGQDTPNDYAMLHEVLSRRFATDEDRPDLLVVDGGKGQLSVVLQALDDVGVTGIPVVSIAKGQGPGARAKGLWKDKREEAIYLPGRKHPVILGLGSGELMLLQRLRDESHRFAIRFHRKLKVKTMRDSILDDIPGLGPVKKRAILKKFGGLENLKKVTEEELGQIKGVTTALAQQIRQVIRLRS